MNKPITLIREEFIERLTETINKSGLPAFIIEPILRDIYSEVKVAMQKQLEEDTKRYLDSLDDDETE